MRRKKMLLAIVIACMAVGFAAVSTVLFLTGTVNIASNDTDFDVHFSSAVLDGVDKSNILISPNKESIDFTSRRLVSKDEETVLEYEITNNSSQYNAKVKLRTIVNDKDDLLTVTNDPTEVVIEAKGTIKGTLTIKLKSEASEESTANVKLTFDVSAVERTSSNNSTLITNTFGLSGYLFDDHGAPVTNGLIVVYSDPKYVTTNNEGYYTISDLEQGYHEAFYVPGVVQADVESLSKAQVSDMAIAIAEFSTNSNEIIFHSKYRFTDMDIKSNKASGTLTDYTGQAISNAIIVIKNGDNKYIAKTDEHGNFDLKNIAPGEYDFYVFPDKTLEDVNAYTDNQLENNATVKGTLNTVTGELTIKEKIKTEASLEEKSKTVSGVLLDKDGNPVANRVIVVVDGNGKRHVTKTDANGNFTVEGIETEVSYIYVMKEGITEEQAKNFTKQELEDNSDAKGTITDKIEFDTDDYEVDSSEIGNSDNVSYKINLNSNGGSAVGTITVKPNNKYGLLPTPTKTGYRFVGWYLNSIKVTEDSIVMGRNIKELVAHWEANTYTVTLDKQNSEAVISKDSIDVVYDGTYEELPTPTLDGYTFAGWYTSAEYTTKVEPTDTVEIVEDIILVAKWSQNEYTVSFDANGGTPTPDEMDVTYNEPFGTLPTVSRTGYTFAGWHFKTDEGEIGSLVESTTIVKITSDKTLIADWTANSVIVTLDPKAGSLPTGVESTITLTYDGKYEDLPTPTLTGYEHEGWYLDEELTQKITDSTTISNESAHTIYAKYTAQQYTLTFDSAGGTNASSIQVTYDAKYTNLPTTSKTGYTFAGWFIGEEQLTEDKDVKITEDKQAVAHWTKNTDTGYTVKYWTSKIGKDKNTHNEENYDLYRSDPKTGETEESVTPEVITIDGFKKPSAETKAILADGTMVIDYYYERNTYSVTVNTSDKGVSGVTGAGSYEYGEEVTIGYTIATGYSFVNITGDKTTSTFDMPASDVTMQVNASANTYTITFKTVKTGAELNNGSTDTKTVTYDSTYGTLPVPTVYGYTFAGWFTEASCSDENKIEADSVVKITSDIDVYADWTANSHNVSFNSNGGTDVTTILTPSYGETYGATFPENPTRTGYTFAGWFIGEEETAITGSTIFDRDDDITITARWTPNVYTIKLNPNGGSFPAGTELDSDGYASVDVTFDSEYGDFPTATYDEYRLVGWYTDNTYTTKIASDTIVTIASDQTLIAKWNPAAARLFSYTNTDETSVTNLQDALDELYCRVDSEYCPETE